MSFKNIAKSIGKAIVGGVHEVDQRLTRASTHLMKLKVGTDRPIHPKNILRLETNSIWFENYFPKSGKVLDLGAGAGSYSVAAAKRGSQVTAIEYFDGNIQLIHNLRLKLPNPNSIEVIKHDLEKHPYPIQEAVYDLVISHDVLEHLHHRQQHLIEIFRALKPGGRFVVTAPNRMTAWKQARSLVGLSPLADEDHKIEYTRAEFLAELSKAGFTKIIYEHPTVVDAPISGLLDMLGPMSIKVYGAGVEFKKWLGKIMPSQSNGFWLFLRNKPLGKF